MRFPVLLILLLTNLVGVSVQQCTREGFQVIADERLFASVGSEATDPSDFFINETYYNCLSTLQTIGDYTTMSVSLLYTVLSAPDTLREIRYVMMCIGDAWNLAAQNDTALTNNDTRTDCYECTDTANNEDYCAPCDSSCTGLNQCYGPNATQCCSYNDGGNCVADCGMNREGNTTFQCVCSNFWTGANCDVCSLDCVNGGTQQSDCSACQCVPGYDGTLCDVNINECSPNPCQNNGTCTDGINSYMCSCVPGYNGTNCETNIDECSPSPCQNGGNCTDRINSYTCSCVPGYNGTNCKNNIDECSPNPCQNGGICTDGVNMYNCTCVDGYNGTNCENNIDECSPNPCQNGGTCNDGVNMYNCTCVDGYNGTSCDNNIDECSPNPCQIGETCIDGINSYNCSCTAGFTGTNCETNINECSPNPCQIGETCIDGINSYNCLCAAGFTGTNCETNIDECSPNPCQNGGRCTDLINDYNCTCDPVYSGHNCSDCAIPNCEQCQPSSQNVMGECTKCAGVFVLDKGTCNDNCGIFKCILCNKTDIKCIQCEEGYSEDKGQCFEEKPDEEGQNNDGLSVGAIIGIIVACVVTALVILIVIFIATTVLFTDDKKQTRNSKSPNRTKLFNHGNVQNPVYTRTDINETMLYAVEENNNEPVKSDNDDEVAVTGEENELLKEDKKSLKEEKDSLREEKESIKEEKELLKVE